MLKPQFGMEFEQRPLGQMGAPKLGIRTLEGANLDVLQREIGWNLAQRQEQMNSYLHARGLSINEAAIHNRIERIMNLDADSLDVLQKEVTEKLAQKKVELERKLRSL